MNAACFPELPRDDRPPVRSCAMAPVVTLCLLLAVPSAADEPQPKTTNQKIVEVAGTAEFLRSVPKHFATLQAVDAANHRVTLLLEGEKLAKVWPLAPDAEVKVLGWWGRLDQL